MPSRELDELIAEIDTSLSPEPDPEQPFEYDPGNCWDARQIEVFEARTGTFMQMLQEAIDSDYQIPVRGGSALHFFQEIEDETRSQLDRIDPELGRDVMYSDNYRSEEARAYHEDNKGDTEDLLILTADHNRRLEDLSRKLIFRGGDAILAFDESPHEPMKDTFRSCELASFLMQFNAVTGSDLTTVEIAEAIGRKYRLLVPGLPDHSFMKIFSTKTFKSEFPNVSAQPIAFVGCTLEDLANLHEKITNKYPDAEVRAVLSVLSSQAGSYYSIIHNVVPQKIDSNGISVVHDPARYGGESKEFDTKSLLWSWYRAHGAGYLLVTQGKDS